MEIAKRRKKQWYYGCPASCSVCGGAFGALRVTAMYCSDKCKQKAYREMKKKRKEADGRGKRLQQSFALIFDQGS